MISFAFALYGQRLALIGLSFWTITEDNHMAQLDLSPVHPGEILVEEFLTPHGMTPYAAAKLLRVPRTRVERLCRHETSMTADMALRLEALFGAEAQFWLNLQDRYNLLTVDVDVRAEISKIRRTEAA